MKKKIIISIVCLLAITGILVYCINSNKQDVSDDGNAVDVKETVKVDDKKKEVKTKTTTETKVTSSNDEDVEKEEASKSNTTSSNKNVTSSKSEEVVSSNTSNEQSNSYVSNQEVVQEPVIEKTEEVKEEVVVEVQPTPEVVTPSYACPGGVDQNLACDVILDSNSYYATFSSESEANSSGEYYLNEVAYIGEMEITNYSIQAVYRNDHSIAYYGLNLWSNGSLIN